MRYGIATLFIILIAVGFTACVSVPEPEDIPSDLSPMEYFQKAQEAVTTRNDYDTAMVYYKTFKERFPDDLQRNIEADYEIAFLHYKQEEYATAKAMFKEIIARYQTEDADKFKEWPLILSRKILQKIEDIEAGIIIEEE